jgi:hypothetical protein
MEEEEYEFDIQFDKNKNLWTTLLKDGRYLINAKIKGFKEINKYIEIGNKKFNIQCEPELSSVPVLKVQAIDIQSGKPIKNVFFELWKENTQLPEEGLSGENGSFEFKVRQIGIL